AFCSSLLFWRTERGTQSSERNSSRIAPRTLWVAKVSNLRPRSGSNISTAFTSPMMPAPTRSPHSTEAGRFMATRCATYFTRPAYSTSSLSLQALLPVARYSAQISSMAGISQARSSRASGRGFPGLDRLAVRDFVGVGFQEMVYESSLAAGGLRFHGRGRDRTHHGVGEYQDENPAEGQGEDSLAQREQDLRGVYLGRKQQGKPDHGEHHDRQDGAGYRFGHGQGVHSGSSRRGGRIFRTQVNYES